MWSRLSPHGFIIFLIVLTLVLFFTFWFTHLEEFQDYIPPWLFRTVLTVYLACVLLWPLDLLFYWDRISGRSAMKDRVLVLLLVTLILYVFPVYWYGTLPFQTGVFALTFGLVIPTLFLAFRRWRRAKPVISPDAVWAGGSQSPEGQRFLDRFPDANRMVYGLNLLCGEKAHLLLHKRLGLPGHSHAGIDLVMDVPVNRETGEYSQGRERLHCYLFLNRGHTAGVGLLPSTNIGRALDYGFSDEEMEEAISNARSSEARWPVVGDLPLQAQLHRGPVYRV